MKNTKKWHSSVKLTFSEMSFVCMKDDKRKCFQKPNCF